MWQHPVEPVSRNRIALRDPLELRKARGVVETGRRLLDSSVS
jgi:hypothetical protein